MQKPCGDAGHWEGWREQAPHLNARILSSREWQRKGQSGPFLSCPNAPGDRNWQQELGFTQDSIYSHPGERMEDTEVKIATKSLGGFSVGCLDAEGEFLELRVSPTPE